MARRSRNKNTTKKNKKRDSDLESSVSSEVDEEELKLAVDVQTEPNTPEGSFDDIAGEGDESNESEIDTDAMLDPKKKAAISLDIRRKLEERDESRRFRADLDYLEEDFDNT